VCLRAARLLALASAAQPIIASFELDMDAGSVALGLDQAIDTALTSMNLHLLSVGVGRNAHEVIRDKHTTPLGCGKRCTCLLHLLAYTPHVQLLYTIV
jgi:hypothetical protein